MIQNDLWHNSWAFRHYLFEHSKAHQAAVRLTTHSHFYLRVKMITEDEGREKLFLPTELLLNGKYIPCAISVASRYLISCILPSTFLLKNSDWICCFHIFCNLDYQKNNLIEVRLTFKDRRLVHQRPQETVGINMPLSFIFHQTLSFDVSATKLQ